MMFWYGGHWVFWEAALMWIGMIAFWSLLVWAIYAVARSDTRRVDSTREVDPLLVLDRRLASGDIGSEEYRRLVDVMRENKSPRASSGAER